MNQELKTDRVTVSRLKDQGAYDRETVNSILDEGKICHVGFVIDNQPYVVPMAFARMDDIVI